MKLLIHSKTSTAQPLKFGDGYVISTHAFHVGTKFKSMLVKLGLHYCDVKLCTIASQITSLTIVYSTVYSDADQRKHQMSASLAFVRGIHRGPVNSPHKWPVTRKMFPFDDVIMEMVLWWSYQHISLRWHRVCYATTVVRKHSVCRCHGTNQAPGHQQRQCWLTITTMLYESYHVRQTLRYSHLANNLRKISNQLLSYNWRLIYSYRLRLVVGCHNFPITT